MPNKIGQKGIAKQEQQFAGSITCSSLKSLGTDGITFVTT